MIREADTDGFISGGVTAPKGFRAAGIHAGIKAENPDLALIVSDVRSTVAGTFTQNRVKAAPVQLCEARIGTRRGRAIVVNSGNANACTGPEGWRHAEMMVQHAADVLQMDPMDVYVCSTGTIGVPLPIDSVLLGIEAANAVLSETGGDEVARAIMTTDKAPKTNAITVTIDDVIVTLGIAAKGAGMIEPNMATMLAFVTTDAAVDAESLQTALSEVVDRTFNRISVDGEQSTNDTVLIMANGQAWNQPLEPGHPDWGLFCNALEELCLSMALAIVSDGEGATKTVKVVVKGARTEVDAQTVARTIGNSLLVKTSWFGCDPNWGRVIAAAGYSGVEVEEGVIDIYYDDVCAVAGGMLDPATSLDQLEAVLKNDRFALVVDLNLGDESSFIYACDCGHEYVRINSEYTT